MRCVSSLERIAQKKGMEKGMEKGIGKGRARLLRLLIQQRFGAPPPEVEARLQDATPEQLEHWALRVLDAASLGEVFRPDSEHGTNGPVLRLAALVPVMSLHRIRRFVLILLAGV